MLWQSHFAFSFADRVYPRGKMKGEIIVDCFAGGGGASLGIERALGRPVDIAANHSRKAIDCHQTNHPETWHLCEDIRKIDPVEACEGRPVGLAWFSPDCKHFSRAKGGKPLDQRIRGLAWVVIDWAKAVRPRIIILENVREFADWGPLTKENKPDPERKGLTFRRWLGRLKGLGYAVETRVLDAADYGAPTHRRRLFLIARCDGKPIRWPKESHGPGRAKSWRPAADVIDWSIPCPSIFLSRDEAKSLGFDVRRPLKPKTLDRIGRGVVRYVIDNPCPFIVRTNHGSDHWRGQAIDEPLATVTGRNGYGVACPFLVPRFGERAGQQPRTHTVEEPIPVVTAREGGGFNLVAGSLVSFRGDQDGRDLTRPMPTVTANSNRGRDGGAAPIGLVAAHIAKHFGGVVGSDLDDPLATVTATDHNSLVAANLISNTRGDKQWFAADEPLRTVRAGGTHHAVVESRLTGGRAKEVAAFVSKYYGEGGGCRLDGPLATVTSKDRFALVAVGSDRFVIDDIGMRMLIPRELARAQGFPDSYFLEGSKADQVKLIGNSVCPDVAEAIVRANA